MIMMAYTKIILALYEIKWVIIIATDSQILGYIE